VNAVSAPIRNLFSSAKSKSGIEYIYTLVRVDGLALNSPDPLLNLQSELQINDTGLSDQPD